MPRLAPLLSLLLLALIPATAAQTDEQRGPERDPLREGRRLLDEDLFEEALAEARRAVEADSKSAEARVLAGDALYRRGDFDEAEEAYRTAVELDPKVASGHFGVGRILRTLGRYGEAAASFHEAAKLEPENARYLRILSNHLARRSDVIEMLERYLQLPPDEEERIRENVRSWIALLRFLGEEPLNEVVAAEPADLPMNVLRGQAYLKARLNKREGVRFAFDTGATGLTVSPRLVKRAKLESIRSFSITGMGGKGTIQGHLVLIRELQAGGIRFRNVPAVVAEPAGLEEGLMGPSLFSAFRIRVDLEAGTVSFRPRSEEGAPPARPEGQPPHRIPFRNVGGQLVVPAALNGTTLNAMVDTGAQTSSASISAVPRVKGLEVLSPALSRGRSLGLAGAMQRRTLRTGTLEFAGRKFNADGMPCVDLSAFSRALESEIYVILGFPELARFVFEIDYATNTLVFAPRGD